MKERLLHTPEGVRDIYNSECARKLYIEEKLNKVMKQYGYENIQTPTFEYFDIFSEERGTVPSKDMYKFFDREGNTLVLRPDMTPSIARCVAKYFKEETSPIRLCYSGNTFINSSEYQGKLKEYTQLGAELINDSSIEADGEMLSLIIQCLKTAGLKEFQVEVGQVQFFKALIEEAGFNAEETEQLRSIIENKNIFGIEAFMEGRNISNELKSVLTRLPELFGGPDRLSKIKELTTNKKALAAIERLEKLYELMKLYGYERFVSFDLGMLSKYEYYTGVIFYAYTYGIGDAVISGGRYDSLVEQFGKKAPAIGMAVMIDKLMLAISRQKLNCERECDKILIIVSKKSYNKAVKTAVKLREEGRNVCILIEDMLPDDTSGEALRYRFGAAEVIRIA